MKKCWFVASVGTGSLELHSKPCHGKELHRIFFPVSQRYLDNSIRAEQIQSDPFPYSSPAAYNTDILQTFHS